MCGGDQGTAGRRLVEQKAMIGWKDSSAAKKDYLAAYEDGWKCGPITTMTVGGFREWLKSGDTTKRVAGQVSKYGLTKSTEREINQSTRASAKLIMKGTEAAQHFCLSETAISEQFMKAYYGESSQTDQEAFWDGKDGPITVIQHG